MEKTKIRKAFTGVLESYHQLCESNRNLNKARKEQERSQDVHNQWQQELSNAMGEDCLLNIEHEDDIYQMSKLVVKDSEVNLELLAIIKP